MKRSRQDIRRKEEARLKKTIKNKSVIYTRYKLGNCNFCNEPARYADYKIGKHGLNYDAQSEWRNFIEDKFYCNNCLPLECVRREYPNAELNYAENLQNMIFKTQEDLLQDFQSHCEELKIEYTQIVYSDLYWQYKLLKFKVLARFFLRKMDSKQFEKLFQDLLVNKNFKYFIYYRPLETLRDKIKAAAFILALYVVDYCEENSFLSKFIMSYDDFKEMYDTKNNINGLYPEFHHYLCDNLLRVSSLYYSKYTSLASFKEPQYLGMVFP